MALRTACLLATASLCHAEAACVFDMRPFNSLCELAQSVDLCVFPCTREYDRCRFLLVSGDDTVCSQLPVCLPPCARSDVAFDAE